MEKIKQNFSVYWNLDLKMSPEYYINTLYKIDILRIYLTQFRK